jgi:hypothetical protein
MALQIVPSKNPAPVKDSLILAIAGIPQPHPLRPNGRVFRRLAGEVPCFTITKDGDIEERTYEEAFIVRFMRWLPETMQKEFAGVFERGISMDEMKARFTAFLPKLRTHNAGCPAPWQADVAQAAQGRAA